MEYLPDNKILKYNPDTLVALRKVYNLDKPGQMDEAIDLLDAWVKKQSHFVRKDFLERIPPQGPHETPTQKHTRIIETKYKKNKGLVMEKLPDHRILKFHPDTFEIVRKEHNLDKPGQMDAAIDVLDDWIKKQAHFTKKDFPREYLERTIILDKGSVERAKNQLDKLFTMRTSNPNYFEKPDASHKDYEILHEYYVDALLPKLTKDHYRIYAAKLLKDGISSKMLLHCYQFGSLVFEHVRSNEYCAGFVGIIDYRGINLLDFIAQINVSEMHQFILFITEGYQMRVKGIHLLTTSKAIELLVRMFKQVFSKKIGDRIRVHATIESLHECVPKELLPEEFGGELKSLVDHTNDWVKELSIKENIEFFKEMNKALVNEKLRDGRSNGKSDILGISGSFRSLNVD